MINALFFTSRTRDSSSVQFDSKFKRRVFKLDILTRGLFSSLESAAPRGEEENPLVVCVSLNPSSCEYREATVYQWNSTNM